MNFNDLIKEMLKCEQTKGQSVKQHCMDVYDRFQELIDVKFGNWRLPSWFEDYKDRLTANLHSNYITSNYINFHDIGKPHCRVVDEQGKVHFPNHAEVSKRVYLEAEQEQSTFYPHLQKEVQIVANLIGWDMVLHDSSAEEIQNYCNNVWTVEDACTLLLAALSEIHSNAALFGGNESQGFKAKWKNLDRRGRQICKHYFGDKNE